MKEATGELNMTVVTIIAIGAIIGFFWIMWPQIKNTIDNTWNSISCGAECKNGVDPNTGKCKE